MDQIVSLRRLEREARARDVSNWLATVIAIFQEQYRRPNYVELAKRLEAIDAQIPQVKRALIYLNNTSEDK